MLLNLNHSDIKQLPTSLYFAMLSVTEPAARPEAPTLGDDILLRQHLSSPAVTGGIERLSRAPRCKGQAKSGLKWPARAQSSARGD